MIVVQGDPGTGKTVVAIYMIKLLMDIKAFTSLEDLDRGSRFAEFFTETHLRWNSTPTDWIASRNALEDVGSIHTVQGYALNYVGVIIGPDLRFNSERQRLYIHRETNFDKKGKENNPALGRKYSDVDLLRFITQIYAVLLTRGIRGSLRLCM
jgi:DUF2075 family protein